jgi:hypothetical protein
VRFFGFFLLFCVALLPRVLFVGTFITSDEEKWVVRAETFLDALQTGEYARTNQTGHPGVTTMGSGAIAVFLARKLEAGGWLPTEVLTQDERYLALLRLPMGFFNALALLVVALLLVRLFDMQTALLATLFCATDPFLIAHAQLLHVDGFLTSWMCLALLAALAAFRYGRERMPQPAAPRGLLHLPINYPLLFVSAFAGGLAFLTKSPSAILLPTIGVIALVASHTMRQRAAEPGSAGILPATMQASRLRSQGISCECEQLPENNASVQREGSPARQPAQWLRSPLIALLLWLVVAAGVWALLWPAVWVAPLEAAGSMVAEVTRNGAVPHANGNFFLGRPVADPGPLFYPVALVLRMTPWTLLGLLALGIAACPCWRRTAEDAPPPAFPAHTISIVILFILLFLLPMSVLSKKFDRYILPIFPFLNILAAIGWVQLWRLVQRHVPMLQPARRGSPLFATTAFAGIAAVSLATVLWYHPYELAYYNPLPGGANVASRTLLIGRGEGLEKAGTYIATHSETCDRPVFAFNTSGLLEDFICQQAQNELFAAEFPPRLSYAVLYINQLQRNPQILDTMTRLWGNKPADYTVRLHGIDYARVYRMHHADFAANISLSDYRLHTSAIRESGVFSLTMQWYAREHIPADYQLLLRLYKEGAQIQRIERSAGPPDHPTPTWKPGETISSVVSLPLALDAPPGNYTATLALLDRATQQPLPLLPRAGRNDYINNETALLLEPIQVPFQPLFGPSIHLTAYEIDTTASDEGQIYLHTRWKTHRPLTTPYMVFIQVLDSEGERLVQIDVPPAGPAAPPQHWPVGAEVSYTHTIPLSATQASASSWVVLGLYHPDTWERLPVRGEQEYTAAPAVEAGSLLLRIQP